MSIDWRAERQGGRAHISRRMFVKGLVATAAASMLLPVLESCSSSSSEPKDPVEATLFLFDTTVLLSAYCSQDVLDKAVERCNYFESIFSRTVEGSDVWNINHAAGKPVEVQPETADIIAKSLEYSVQTDGLFDITIGAASVLWDFVEGVRPSDEELKEAVAHIDYRSVVVDGNTVTLTDPQAKIDLGGIAKGYIADDIASLLQEAECQSALINLGGNVYALGSKPTGSKWKVGVRNPNKDADGVIASCECASKSVVTSGLYERNFTEKGVMYYHILDPSTGYPAKTDLLSSSILSNKSIDGDVFATVLFLLGVKRAKEFLAEKEDMEGLLIDAESNVILSEGSTFKEA